MSRRKLIAGNWKLHLGPKAAAELAQALRDRLSGVTHADIVVFPTALSLASVVDALRRSGIDVGGPWAHAEPKGAFTGCNSAALLREVGADWLLAGHSEVRRDLGETDERVNASVKAALAAGLLPILCIGETLDERNAGRLEEVLERQVRVGLSGLAPDQILTATLAYEPVWAIGTGVVATPAQAQDAHAFVRGVLRALLGSDLLADQMRIMYGGSVTADNAAELLSLPDVDGCLVGGASLKPDSFAGIVAGAAS